MKKAIYLFTVTALLTSLFFSCKDKDTNPVKEIRLDKNNIVLAVGVSTSITATIIPHNATESTLTWSSGNSSVASISAETESRYLISAKSVGTAIITVTSKNGKQSATCAVTVINAEPEMVPVEGGSFTMGCTDGEGGSNELPAHSVTLNSYKIAKYTVTQRQWDAIMGNNLGNATNDNKPVANVSWSSAQQFIQKLNAATGKNYRLPTEAEWEYAARGGNNGKDNNHKYSGSNDVNAVAWYTDNSGFSLHPVGKKAPNELGIYDMSGNIWEWCNDWYGAYTDEPQTNPAGPASGTSRIVRGGCFYTSASACRVSFRTSTYSEYSGPDLSFRLVHP
jgi:formylglycine-generating enzyme required for sulfatase activity